MLHRFIAVPSAVLALAGCSQHAQESSTTQSQPLSAPTASAAKPPPRGPRHRPPQAAFDACASKAIDDACSVAIGDRTIAGTCVSPPPGAPDTAAFCRPSGPPPHPPHGPPPPEALTACDGKTADASCTVALPDGRALEGTCRTPPPDSGETRLACAPAHPPPPPR
jgi:hypothetical protein